LGYTSHSDVVVLDFFIRDAVLNSQCFLDWNTGSSILVTGVGSVATAILIIFRIMHLISM